MPVIGFVMMQMDGIYTGHLATLTIRQNIHFMKK